MLRHGCQAVWFLLTAIFAAFGAARAASEDIAPLPPSSTPRQSQAAGDGQSGYSYKETAVAADSLASELLASDTIPVGNDNMLVDNEGMGGGSMADDEGMGNKQHSHRVDTNSPAFLFGAHVREAGEWMTGYRYSNTYMEENRSGTSNLSTLQALNFLNPPPPTPVVPGTNAFMMVPTTMTMESHMLPIMRGVTDDVTAYVMPMWMVNTMQMVNRAGMTTEAADSGFGDLPFGVLWRAYKCDNDELILNIGFSAPTGDIDGINPRTGKKYPYTMRLGHGTWDARPALTYRHYWDRASFGLQGSFDLPMGLSDAGYQVGDEYRVNGWFAFLLDEEKKLAATFRVEGLWRNNYVGADSALNPFGMPGNDPNMRGGDYMNFGYGIMYRLPHHLGRLDFEAVTPIIQNVQGVQPGFDWAFAGRYLIMF